jgi:SAM-dependent methyltransferase
MLDRARAEVDTDAARVSFVHGRAEALPLPDAQADFAIARYLFQHVPDPGAVAREALRILKPGGRLAVIDLDGALWGLAAPTFPQVMPVYAKTGRAQAALGGNRLIGRALFRILRDAGFADVQLDAFVYHSDAKGLEEFGPQLDPDRLLPMVKRGLISGAEFEVVRRAHDTFMATPGAYVMMIGLIASGARPVQVSRNSHEPE